MSAKPGLVVIERLLTPTLPKDHIYIRIGAFGVVP